MVWHDLLFAHWRVPPEALRPHVPPSLALDTRDGAAWLGVVPFRMTGVGMRGLPDVPGTASFPEINVRTYVTQGAHPGVWFFSLDAANPLAVATARRALRLPYYLARMRARRRHGWIEYRSERIHRGAPPATFVGRYRALASRPPIADAALAAWLTERYCLYALARDGSVRRMHVRHRPWTLEPAECEIAENRMAEPLGLRLSDPPDSLLFARRLDVLSGGWVRGA
jgi:uncharacterized protein YqjF (DUF2071 family)